MKILTNKKEDELLKRIAACQIIAANYIADIEALEQITENLSDMAIKIGGAYGISRVVKIVNLYHDTKVPMNSDIL